MNTWKVSKILGGNRISVVPDWTWNENSGHEVVILGYQVSLKGLPEEFAESLALSRLNSVLMNKNVVLKNPKIVDSNNNLHCQVFLNDVDIAKYFIDFEK